MQSVSVVITTYSRPDMVAEALRSVLDQTVLPDEVLIIDDGSPEPLRLELGDLPIPVRIVRQENGGLAAARNTGASESVSDIVMFLDDDDLFAAHRVANALAAHAGSDIVCCAQRGFEHGSPVDLSPADQPVRRREVPAVALLERTTPNFGATSVRRSAWTPMNESYRASQDIEWWVQRALEHRSVCLVDSHDLVVRRHSGPRYLNGSPKRIEASRRLLEEHAAFFDSHRRAKAFRLARISMMERGQGRRADALRSAVQSIGVLPTRAGLGSLARAVATR